MKISLEKFLFYQTQINRFEVKNFNLLFRYKIN